MALLDKGLWLVAMAALMIIRDSSLYPYYHFKQRTCNLIAAQMCSYCINRVGLITNTKVTQKHIGSTSSLTLHH